MKTMHLTHLVESRSTLKGTDLRLFLSARRVAGGQEVAGSNPVAPIRLTMIFHELVVALGRHFRG